MATQVLSDLDFNSVAKATNLPAPTADGDAATKGYVDSAVEGLAWKDSVRVASAANINLASPGATIDGITMATSDRVLVKDQSTASQNGIYIWNGAAVPMTRALDASTFPELEQAVVTVEEGSSAAATFRQTAINGTIDSDDVLWTSFGNAVPDATATTKGIVELATQGEVDTGTDSTRVITPETLSNWSGRTKRAVANIGDGSATSYAVTHNFNTRDVVAKLYRNSGNYDEVIVDIEHTNVNTVTYKFASAPASNAFRAVVLA